MELVLKIPKEKPPFVGVLFEKEWDADSLNADLIEDQKPSTYSIVFEYCNNNLNLRLMSTELLIIRQYTHLKFDPEKLKTWLYMSKGSKTYNFGHIILKKDNHILVKTSKKKINFVLKVDKIKLTLEEKDQMYR